VEIKSSCECDTKTIFNARVDNNGDILTEGEQIEVGGDDRYVSMCRKCFYQKTKNPLYVRKDQ
jgi:thymidine kinase